MTEEEMDAAIAENIALGLMEECGVNERGEKMYRLTEKGFRDVEERLLPQIGVPSGKSIIEGAKKAKP